VLPLALLAAVYAGIGLVATVAILAARRGRSREDRVRRMIEERARRIAREWEALRDLDSWCPPEWRDSCMIVLRALGLTPRTREGARRTS
jgi:Trm5-related predicted tRNA methylase